MRKRDEQPEEKDEGEEEEEKEHRKKGVSDGDGKDEDGDGDDEGGEEEEEEEEEEDDGEEEDNGGEQVEEEEEEEDPTKLYCVCKMPWDGRFMVECDRCENWFHPQCVGTTSKEVRKLPTFYCPDCAGKAGVEKDKRNKGSPCWPLRWPLAPCCGQEIFPEFFRKKVFSHAY
jgi:hypothetical protein